MSLNKNLPCIKAEAIPGMQWDPPSNAMSKWETEIMAAKKDEGSISIYDVIGDDPWTGEGVTAKRVAGILRSIGDRDVVVNINSPGGDLFEGLAIYNLLREHPNKVTVKVVGIAASAASVIAMAGDERLVAKAGFLMIHNAWGVVVGNRHDLNDAADWLGKFDGSMAELYAAATGMNESKAAKMMDAGTWLDGQESVNHCFATGLLPSDEITADASANKGANAAVRKVETMLAKQGMPRSERRDLIRKIKGMPGAVLATQDAGVIEAIKGLTNSLKESIQ